LGALAAAAFFAVPAAWAANSSVSIQNFSFQPQGVTVNVGESVTWTMKDANTQHTVTADDSSFNSGGLNTGQTFSHTFTQAGSFSYHCNIHPSMTGTVTVVGSGPPPTQPAAPPPAPAQNPPQAAPAPAAAPTATAPRTTAAPATTVAPTTTLQSSTTTTIAPPAAADTGTTSSTLAAAGGGVQQAAAKSSSGDSGGVSPWLIALAVVLVTGATAGGVLLRRRVS
jgi:plastocyanin